MSDKAENLQPPPRKLKLGQELRAVQSEQLSSLHSKFQQESDLLEEIREFSKQRASLERTYAQSLQKLAAQFQQKRVFPTLTEEQKHDEQQHRLALQVWKAILDETEKVSKARLTASETLSSQIAEVIKMQKNTRAQTLKKCDDIFNICQEEIQATVRDLSKAKKNYCETEAVAQEAREKALEAENKLKKGSLKFFQSKTTLEKQMAKLAARRETCDRRSAHMRNDYLLAITSANAHQQRFYCIDLPHVMSTLDGNFYDRLKDYYSIFATTEIELGTYVRACFDKVQGEAELVTREYHSQRFLQKCPVLTTPLQYHYSPLETDQVSSMVIDQKESLYLDREARKWATDVAREAKSIEDNGQVFQDLQSSILQLKGSDTSSDSGFGQEKDSEQKYETLRETLRKSETTKMKAEAKLNMLKNAGINVDQWLDSAYEAIAKEAEIEAQMKAQQAAAQARSQSDGLNASRAMNSFDSFDDTFEATLNEDPTPAQPSSVQEASIRATALYNYQAQRDDELTIRGHEYLEIIEESEGDGWVKAKNDSGQSGYIPESYVQVERRHVARQLSNSSEGSPGWSHLSKMGQPYSSSASLTDYEVQAAMANQAMSASGQTVGECESEQADGPVCFARALYDYQGCSQEELSFSEGCVIKVLKQDDEGDGFWEGELNGRVGVFPSLLVEELGCPSVNEVVTPEEIEESDEPPSTLPPSLPPPPLPDNLPTLSIYSEVDRRRPASADIPESPNACPFYTRSAPQSPTMPGLKPARAAPPPPGKIKKKLCEHREHRKPETRYSDEGPITMV
ncbi:F-BAR and double SH3 domains protein 2-like isoform X2 [Acanthaster planci]|uniref:F-BAR and double SH3 domains protein 2-like isoform X2 n=1 Tax=Acanthaster planci TaxID=133434 RepID=A0A8B7YGK9_ACAPL|nr:F-BAR and double SH3 domains protein 2-like isoform X2 [Acanthaster planci]